MLRRHASVAAVGLVLGLIGAGATARVLRGLLFQVDELDSGVLVVVGLTLMLAAVVASWIPARRASRTDVLAAIRTD